VAEQLPQISERRGEGPEAADHRAAGRRMAGAVTEHGGDGAWFLRAFDYFGSPEGSAASPEGQIFVEPQGMCLMAGIGLDDGRATAALDAGAAARSAVGPACLHGVRSSPG